jgi:hypothetical protein
MSTRILSILLAGLVSIGGLIWWFLEHFLYDLFWAILDHRHIEQAKVFAYTLANITPFILAIIVGAMLYATLRYEFRKHLAGVATNQDHPSVDQGTQPQATLGRNYIHAAEAIKYIANESEWGNQVRTTLTRNGMRLVPLFAATEEFVKAARDGKIIVFGRFNRMGEPRLIAQQYWLDATIEQESVIAPKRLGITSSISQDDGERYRFIRYDALCVEETEVHRLWPRSPHAWMGV